MHSLVKTAPIFIKIELATKLFFFMVPGPLKMLSRGKKKVSISTQGNEETLIRRLYFGGLWFSDFVIHLPT